MNSPLPALEQALSAVVVGQSAVIRQLLVALVADGHVILEGVPGTGKTLMVKTLAQLLTARFRRVQLTPDILPSDILGVNIFDLASRNFVLKKGPVFTDILLADEINRTPPKTQSALLEAMEERQVTLDGESLPLGDFFWVVATQNSVEFEGTYPLPEAQLDRFLFKLLVGYPGARAEKQMLLDRGRQGPTLPHLADAQQIRDARREAAALPLAESVIDYLLSLVARTREHPDLSLGASPRSAVVWLAAARAHAWLAGQSFVTPDDVKAVALPLLRHRLILKPEAQIDGLRTDELILALLEQLPVPR